MHRNISKGISQCNAHTIDTTDTWVLNIHRFQLVDANIRKRKAQHTHPPSNQNLDTTRNT